MDMTVEVMLPPRGDTDFTRSAHTKWRVGAPVAVYVPRKTVAVIGMPRTGYIHVTNVPDKSQLAMCERLTREWTSQILEEQETTIEKRLWVMDPNQLPLPMQQQLLQNRQIEIPWGLFKAATRHQGENRVLSDSDLD